MSEQNFEEQKVIVSSEQDLENMNRVDKTKVFWTVILSLFIVSFIFILGYWIGQQRTTADYFKVMPNNSVDVSPLIGMSSDPNSTNNSENYTGDGLEALDSATTAPSNNSLQETIKNTPQPQTIMPPDSFSAETSPPINTNPVTIKQKSGSNIISPLSSSEKKVKTTPHLETRKDVVPHLSDSNGKWAVRLVTVKSEKNARTLKNNLNKMGYKNVNMLKIGVLYRVSVLGFETQKNAQLFQKQAKEKLKLADTLIIKL